MPRAKKILLLHERRETVRLRLKRTHCSGWCGHCVAEVEWFPTLEAAEFLNVSEREVFRLVEASRIHFLEADLYSLLICRRSLEGFGQE